MESVVLTVLLAVGIADLEDYLKKNIDAKKYRILQCTVLYREAVVKAVEEHHPDILIYREGMMGSQSAVSIIKMVRKVSPKTRVIFVGENHMNLPNKTLSKLCDLGVYDIIFGRQVAADAILNLIDNPMTFFDCRRAIGYRDEDDEEEEEEFTPAKFVDHSAPEETPSETNRLKGFLKSDKKPKEEIKVKVIEEPEGIIEEPPKVPPIKTPVKKEVKAEVPKEVVKEQPKPAPVSTPEPTPEPASVPTPVEPEQPKNLSADTSVLTREMYVPTLPATSQRMNRRLTAPHRVHVYTACRDGVGVTTIAFNTAIMASRSGTRTLYIDTRKEHSSVATRLDLWEAPAFIGLEQAIREGGIKHYAKGGDILTGDSQTLPDSLFLGFYSDQALMKSDLPDITEDFIKEARKTFELVIIDSPMNFNLPFGEIDLIRIVVTQDELIATLTGNSLDVLARRTTTPTELIVNRYEAKGGLDYDRFAENFSGLSTNVWKIVSDNAGFFMGDSRMIPYVCLKKRNRKIEAAYASLAK